MPRSRPPAASAVAGPSGSGHPQVQPVVGYWRHGNPPGRAGHTAVLYNDSIVCFGGHLGENLCSSEVLSYHLKKREWKLHTGLEPGPCERDGHTAVLWEHGMYIFGGETTGTNEEYLNDLWHLDLRTCRWAPVTSLDDSPPPCPRRGHAAVVAQNSMYIVAGHTTTGKRLNDVHMFDFQTMAWSEVSSEEDAPDKPQPRSGHSCVAVDDKELVIFGGCHQSPYRLNDTWRFDIHQKSWSSVLGQGDVPPARSEHTAAVMDKSMVIFGGWISDDHVPTALTAALNLETGAWQTVHCKEEFHPPDVADHAGVAWNRGLYVFGGYRNVEQPIEFLTVFELALGARGAEDSCSMPQKMQTDMLRSVGRDQFSDIRLVVADGVQVPAHRVVLAARSEYFRALFDGDMSDSKAPSVSLTTLTQEVALVVLRFMYGGVVEVPPELLLEVLAAANMLLLDELKAECEVRLTKSVTVDNCCALLQSADVHEARALRSHCLSFAVQEYEAVVQGQGYADLLEAAPPLMLELQRALVPRLRTMSAITSMQRGRKRRHSEVES